MPPNNFTCGVVAARLNLALHELFEFGGPMLAVGNGDLWLVSTPFGRRGFFFKMWTEGGPEWQRFAVTAAECPRIPAGFLDEERRIMTESEFQQEYFCKFVDPRAPLFRREILLCAIEPKLTALPIPPNAMNGQITHTTRRYFVGLDLGQKRDYTAIAV